MNWTRYLYGFAKHAALKSKDSTQVGAALVHGRSIVLTGYNGPPSGVVDGINRRERPRKYLFAAHAEANIVSQAARLGIRTDGATLYCTHHPCAACARSLIQAGIQCVMVGPGTTSMPADEFEAAAQMFMEAGVKVEVVCDA